MTTSGSDFDAAKAIADQLKGMEKERQHRILRWVAESLNLNLGTTAATDRRAEESATATGGDGSTHRDAAQLQQRSSDIKTFVDSKRPKSDVQFTAVVAYYYQFEAATGSRRNSIDAQVLQDAARLAGRRRLPTPLKTLNNAKMLGYLDSPERGQFRVNSVGENLVAMALPGGESERVRKKVRSKKPRNAKSKKR
jgi:hypothetical protein